MTAPVIDCVLRCWLDGMSIGATRHALRFRKLPDPGFEAIRLAFVGFCEEWA